MSAPCHPFPALLPRRAGISPRWNMCLGSAHQARSGPADGIEVEVISVNGEPHEVISLDDDEPEHTPLQGEQSVGMLVCSTRERPLFQ